MDKHTIWKEWPHFPSTVKAIHAISHTINIIQWRGAGKRTQYIRREQSSPGNLQVGHVPSNCTRHIPQTSSSGMSQRQIATAFHSLMVAFIFFLLFIFYFFIFCLLLLRLLLLVLSRAAAKRERDRQKAVVVWFVVVGRVVGRSYLFAVSAWADTDSCFVRTSEKCPINLILLPPSLDHLSLRAAVCKQPSPASPLVLPWPALLSVALWAFH